MWCTVKRLMRKKVVLVWLMGDDAPIVFAKVVRSLARTIFLRWNHFLWNSACDVKEISTKGQRDVDRRR